MVTRTRTQTSALGARLYELGADVLEIPTIKIVEPDNLEALRDGLLGWGLTNGSFTSPNGVVFIIFSKALMICAI